MDYQRYRKVLILGYCYLSLGILGLIAGLTYGYFFPGEFSDLTFACKVGLVAILSFLILWAIFFFVFLLSKHGREFQRAYTKYAKGKKKE